MDHRRLRAFVTVAELGGISAAAMKLGYAQSSLSAQVRGLEEDLGVRLLDRTSSGVTLTEAGRRLLPYALNVLELAERMRRAVSATRPIARIGALETLAQEWLPDIVAAFDRGAAGAKSPADVELTVGSRARLESGLASGALDMIFLFDNGVAAAGPHAVVGRDQVVAVAAPEHPLAGTPMVSLDALVRTKFIIAEQGCTTHMLVDRFGRDLTHRTPISMVSGSLAALRRLVGHGRGVALLPYLTALRDLELGELVRLNVPEGLAFVHIEARWRANLGDLDSVLAALVGLARRHQPPVPARADGRHVGPG